jgi:hypothetical protein
VGYNIPHVADDSTLTRTPAICRAGQTCIAIVSREGFATRVVNTGVAEREKNMVVFAKAALVLLRDVLAGDVKLEHRPDSEGSDFTPTI